MISEAQFVIGCGASGALGWMWACLRAIDKMHKRELARRRSSPWRVAVHTWESTVAFNLESRDQEGWGDPKEKVRVGELDINDEKFTAKLTELRELAEEKANDMNALHQELI